MNIMLLTHSFTPEISPPQRRWSIFVDEFGKAGHQVTVVAPNSDRRTTASQMSLLSNPLVTVRRYKSIRRTKTMIGKILKHGIEAMLSFPVAFKAPKPEVVIATVPALPTMMVGYLIGKIYRIPFVIDLRDAWPDLLSESNVIKFNWAEPIVMRFLSHVVKHSDLLVTVTHGLAKKMIVDGATNVATISNGVEIERAVHAIPVSVRGDSLNVLYLGNIGRSQGLETAIRAMALVPESVNLRIVGQGTEKDRLMKLACDLGVDIDFRPPVYGEAVLENYSWADTTLVSLRPDWPSFDHTVPSKLYELLFLDQHVTALVRGEAADIVRASCSGQVVEQTPEAFAEYLRDLVSNRHELFTSGNGSKWVRENASLRESGRTYIRLLEQLVRN